MLLEASGEAVGLPPGVMGNSEVGHLTLGSGRIIYQDLSRINRAITDGSFFSNPVLGKLMDGVVERGRSLHLMGLLSDAGVHSAMGHVKALVKMARERGVTKLYVHAFTDGRDTSPTAGEGYVTELEVVLGCRRAWARWPPSPAATTPWTATSAGSGSSWHTTLWCTARGSWPLMR